MINPNDAVLTQIKKMVKTSFTELRPLRIVTEGPHSTHFSLNSETEVTKDYIAFTNLEGVRQLTPWPAVQYIGLCAPLEVAAGAGKAKAAGAR